MWNEAGKNKLRLRGEAGSEQPWGKQGQKLNRKCCCSERLDYFLPILHPATLDGMCPQLLGTTTYLSLINRFLGLVFLFSSCGMCGGWFGFGFFAFKSRQSLSFSVQHMFLHKSPM